MVSLETENLIQIFIACLDHLITCYNHEIRFCRANDAREAFYSWPGLMFEEAV